MLKLTTKIMEIKYSNIKKIFIIIILYFISTNLSYAEVIKKITILGNERVADETVVIFSKLKIGENLNQIVLNKAIKELYSTNYFKDIKISSDNGNVNINLVENPIIQKIAINGIEEKNIREHKANNFKDRKISFCKK